MKSSLTKQLRTQRFSVKAAVMPFLISRVLRPLGLLVGIVVILFVVYRVLDVSFHLTDGLLFLSRSIWDSFDPGQVPNKNNFFVRFSPVWDFLSGIAIIFALISTRVAIIEYIEGKKRERVKFEAEIDPLIVPSTIQSFYLSTKHTDNTVLLMDIFDEKSSSIKTVFNLRPALDKGVNYPLFVIENIRKGIADEIRIEVSNRFKKNNHWIYDFNEANTVYEGPYRNFVENRQQLMMFKDAQYETRKVCVDQPFAIRLTYVSNYVGDAENDTLRKVYTEVYEARVVNGEFFVLRKYFHKGDASAAKDKLLKGLPKENILVKEFTAASEKKTPILYIVNFDNITNTEVDGIYFSQHVS